MSVPEIDAATLRDELAGEDPPRVLDVREADELANGTLPGILHVPLSRLPMRINEIDRDADWVVVCRVGGRSAQVTEFLKGIGYARVRNLVGGMNDYARLDPSVKPY